MRFSGLTLSLLGLVVGMSFFAHPAAADCVGKDDVEAAFVKQHQQAWHTETVSTGQSGKLQTQVFDYQPPDRMYRKVTSGDETVETIGIGRWAWSNIGSGWSELQPQFAQMVTSFLMQAFATPKVAVEFSCLGEVTFDGKSFNGYQTTPEAGADGKMLARTIYVDPKTGLPAFNIIGEPKGAGEPVYKEAYTYPADVKIEKPI